MRKYIKYYFFVLLLLIGCSKINDGEVENALKISKIDTFKIYTKSSDLSNEYKGFDSPKAVNKIAEIENEYFNTISTSQSKYYGTIWQETAKNTFEENDTISLFEKYRALIAKRNETADSMHCTIYAIEALKAGLGDDFTKLDRYHKEIWKDREYAGWSIGYLLTEKFDWRAYLVLSKGSKEYKSCQKNYKKDGKYHVWKQPNIRLEKVFDFEEDQMAIDSLLRENEFAWGFSEQGWHTWITRFEDLKECNWLGSPSKEYENNWSKPLFLKTKFIEYYDYDSHILIFPPKKIN